MIAGKKSLPLTNKEFRKFGIIMAVLIALAFGRHLNAWAWGSAIGFLVAALCCPVSLALPYRLWILLGKVLEHINKTILLFVFFYGVVMPLAIVFRFIGRNILERNLDADLQSYRVVPNSVTPQAMERSF